MSSSAARLLGRERSAALCALWRAMETSRKNPIFSDHRAAAIAQEVLGPDTMAKMSRATFAPSLQYLVSLRSRVLDDALERWLRSGRGPLQVIQLGVGCDMRALRLSRVWNSNSCRFFELDTPRVAHYRKEYLARVADDDESLVSAASACIQIGFNLQNATGLIAELERQPDFSVDLPTVWMCEGVFEYHPQTFTHNLLSEIGLIASRQTSSPNTRSHEVIFASLDENWKQFLRDQHKQAPVRMAWQRDLADVPWLLDVLRQSGWGRMRVTSELRPHTGCRSNRPLHADQGNRPSGQSLFHIIQATALKEAK